MTLNQAWNHPGVYPAEPGVYEVHVVGLNGKHYAHYNGTHWGAFDTTPAHAYERRGIPTKYALPWCGPRIETKAKLDINDIAIETARKIIQDVVQRFEHLDNTNLATKIQYIVREALESYHPVHVLARDRWDSTSLEAKFHKRLRTHVSKREQGHIMSAFREVFANADAKTAPNDWQPIETAPKDGTEVLLWLGAPWSKVEKAHWFDTWENWQRGDEYPESDDEYCGIGSAVPTHWQPLPEGP